METTTAQAMTADEKIALYQQRLAMNPAKQVMFKMANIRLTEREKKQKKGVTPDPAKIKKILSKMPVKTADEKKMVNQVSSARTMSDYVHALKTVATRIKGHAWRNKKTYLVMAWYLMWMIVVGCVDLLGQRYLGFSILHGLRVVIQFLLPFLATIGAALMHVVGFAYGVIKDILRYLGYDGVWKVIVFMYKMWTVLKITRALVWFFTTIMELLKYLKEIFNWVFGFTSAPTVVVPAATMAPLTVVGLATVGAAAAVGAVAVVGSGAAAGATAVAAKSAVTASAAAVTAAIPANLLPFGTAGIATTYPALHVAAAAALL